MFQKILLGSLLAVGLCALTSSQANAQDPYAYGRVPGGHTGGRDYQRFYHYPYVYYPQNFYGNEYYRSSNSLYYRYPAEMQIPVYNRKWHNEYPSSRRYHWGHHFLTDVF
jgi:hypothetical protein